MPPKKTAKGGASSNLYYEVFASVMFNGTLIHIVHDNIETVTADKVNSDCFLGTYEIFRGYEESPEYGFKIYRPKLEEAYFKALRNADAKDQRQLVFQAFSHGKYAYSLGATVRAALAGMKRYLGGVAKKSNVDFIRIVLGEEDNRWGSSEGIEGVYRNEFLDMFPNADVKEENAEKKVAREKNIIISAMFNGTLVQVIHNLDHGSKELVHWDGFMGTRSLYAAGAIPPGKRDILVPRHKLGAAYLSAVKEADKDDARKMSINAMPLAIIGDYPEQHDILLAMRGVKMGLSHVRRENFDKASLDCIEFYFGRVDPHAEMAYKRAFRDVFSPTYLHESPDLDVIAGGFISAGAGLGRPAGDAGAPVDGKVPESGPSGGGSGSNRGESSGQAGSGGGVAGGAGDPLGGNGNGGKKPPPSDGKGKDKRAATDSEESEDGKKTPKGRKKPKPSIPTGNLPEVSTTPPPPPPAPTPRRSGIGRRPAIPSTPIRPEVPATPSSPPPAPGRTTRTTGGRPKPPRVIPVAPPGRPVGTARSEPSRGPPFPGIRRNSESGAGPPREFIHVPVSTPFKPIRPRPTTTPPGSPGEARDAAERLKTAEDQVTADGKTQCDYTLPIDLPTRRYARCCKNTWNTAGKEGQTRCYHHADL